MNEMASMNGLIFLYDLFAFSGKTLIVFLFIASLIFLIALLIAKASQQQELEVKTLNDKFKDIHNFLTSFGQSKDEQKAETKRLKKEEKEKSKHHKKQKRLFLLRFDGDMKASQAESLREEVNAILQVATSEDQVLCCVESPGGVVHGYGFASSQLARIRDAGIHLTVAVDYVAASGGYLMSCVAEKIIAAPFAIVGSIGVVAQVPNFHRILRKHDVDYKEYTAGEFKRTVSILGEITPKGEEKFIEQLEQTHTLFKAYVSKYRPQLDLKKVATGEYWYGQQALDLGLIDKVQTSDDFLLEKYKEDVLLLEISHHKHKTFQEKIADVLGKSVEKGLLKVQTQLEKQKYL